MRDWPEAVSLLSGLRSRRMARPDWDPYFLNIAKAVAERADCTRRRFGAVLVKDHRIVATGYNGAPAGHKGCLEGGCPRGQVSAEAVPHYSSYDSGGPGHCVAVHAEANALLYAGRDDARGSTLYLWGDLGQAYPCDGCMRLLRAAGVAFWLSPKTVLTSLDNRR